MDPLADKKVIGHLFGRIQDKHLCLLPSLSALSFWSVQPPMQTSNQLLNSLTWPSHSNFSLHNGLGHFVRNSTNNTEMWPKIFSKRFILGIFFGGKRWKSAPISLPFRPSFRPKLQPVPSMPSRTCEAPGRTCVMSPQSFTDSARNSHNFLSLSASKNKFVDFFFPMKFT